MKKDKKIFILILFVVAIFAISLYSSSLLLTAYYKGWRNLNYNIAVVNDFIRMWVFYLSNFDKITLANSQNLIFVLLATTLLPIVLIGIILYIFRDPLGDFKAFEEDESIHGKAEWADEREIKKAGLRESKGMILGKNRRGLFIASGYQHTLLFAPTGSGKGVGFVIPNLLFWEDSIVIHDIKLENYELTSGYRANVLKQQTFLWNPASPDGKSHCYNPLDWVSEKPGQMIDDLQKISSLLLTENEFWQNEARACFLGCCCYIFAAATRIKSLGEVVRLIRCDDVAYFLAVVLDTVGKEIHPVGYMNIASFLQKAEKERSGVISTLNSALELWANPLIDATTATSDFNFSSIKLNPTTIYVGLTPDNIARLKPLMQIFYQQASQFLTSHMPTPEEKIGVMFLMDEFPTLGEMEQFKTGIAYFRGYNVRLFLIIQDTQQLKGIYEEAGMNSFLSNSTYRVTFSANNVETAELISKMLGNKTVKQVSLNRPRYLDFNPSSRSVHESETQRALLLPQEVMQLGDDQILMVEGRPPIKSRKILYYKEKMFLSRLLPPIPIPEQDPYIPTESEKIKVNKDKDG